MINIAENGPNVSGVVTNFAKCRFLNVKSMSKLSSTTPSPPNLVSSIKLYREKWWKCDTRRRRQYLHKVSWPPAPARGSLLQIQIVWRKWGKISEEIPELLDIDSWRHSHKTLNMSTCLLSTLHCFLQLPPALEPQLNLIIYVKQQEAFLRRKSEASSSVANFLSLNKGPGAVSMRSRPPPDTNRKVCREFGSEYVTADIDIVIE